MMMTSRKKRTSMAFYEAPRRSTSALIIEEARRSVRALPTERPYTPADSSRILFGSQGSQSRPPSVFSIGARHFSDEHQSRPPTRKLVPIEKTATEAPQIKLSSRAGRPTPITPVQSLLSLPDSSLSPSPPTIDRPSSRVAIASMVTVGGVASPSTSSLSSVGSADLEPKPSQSSPETSRRSLSAGQRVLSAGKKRVHSAGEKGVIQTHRVAMTTTDKPAPPTGADRQQQRKEKDVAGKGQRGKDRTGKAVASTPTKDLKEALPFWASEVAPLLQELDSASSSSPDHVPALCKTSDSLLSVLERRELLGRTGGVGGGKRRAAVLRTVFRLLDHKDPRLILKLSKIILAMKVTGKNLLNVCKLLFAVARSETNDKLFLEEELSDLLVDVLSMADPGDDPEALVYGLGTLKLLASNAELRAQLGSVGVVGMLAGVLRMCAEKSSLASGDRKLKSQMENVLVQVLMALRNLSESPSLQPDLLSHSVIPHLSATLSDHMANSDIVFSISRILSKLTLLPDCRDAVVHCPTFLPLLLTTLTSHADNAEITVRVCFILGNLTATSEGVREQLYFSLSALAVIEGLSEKYLDMETQQNGGSKSPSRHAEDVLIKLVRLTANLSVHPDVGPNIADSEPTVDHLIRILASLPLSSHEELILNTLATLNNLSYYSGRESYLVRRQREIAELLVGIVLEDNNEGLLECVRVYGNLSRYPTVRNILAEKNVVELLVTVLDSGRRDMVYSSCGVLVNLMADAKYRSALRGLGGIRKLVDVLHDFGHTDWQLAGLVCQTLWNYSEGLNSASSCFGEEETDQLLRLLKLYLDNSHALRLLQDSTDERQERQQVAREAEFLPVARSLLARVQAHHTNLVPLEPPADD